MSDSNIVELFFCDHQFILDANLVQTYHFGMSLVISWDIMFEYLVRRSSYIIGFAKVHSIVKLFFDN